MTIRLNQLTFKYEVAEVLRDVSVEAKPGSVIALLGPNAAGKSTLLRCIIGALKPVTGAVLIDGKPAHRLSPWHLARRISYVPQRSVVSAAFTVRQVVELGRYALPANKRRIDDAIARLELGDIADRVYPALSVGQQQRVTLARALAQLEPRGHLILDEPMSAMDLQHVHQCAGILRELARSGVTVIVAMHDLALAARLADETWLLETGQLVAAGETCDVMTVDQLQRVFRTGFQWIEAGETGPWLVPQLPREYNVG